MNKTFALVILNKNDAPSLEILLNEIDTSDFDFTIGIDGDSSDNSAEVFRNRSIPVLNKIDGGRGGAIKYAINNLNFDYIIFLSSDGEEDPKDLPKIKNSLLKGADLVIASRVGKGSSFKSDQNIFFIHRKIFLLFVTKMINLLFNGNVKDCWNGYRGLSIKKARMLNLSCDNFLLEAQMTIQFLKKKFIVSEIQTIERKRYFGESQNPVFISGWGHIVLLINEFFIRD
jgi:dolichol-phosphate mannosyltransferase